MGHLQDGVWHTDNAATVDKDGAFQRKAVSFRNWITPDGAPGPSGVGGYKAQSGRYHLYAAHACGWAHRTLIFRALKGLGPHISVDFAHPDMMDDGWTFSKDAPGVTGDTLFDSDFMREIYLQVDPKFTGRVTVPILFDKETHSIVSNESSEIIRMFNSAFDGITGDTQDFWPEALHPEIEEVNERVYDTLNNGVYRAGFASTQTAYDDAVSALFDTLDWLEARLEGADYLVGGQPTEADLRLLPTLLRFDPVYFHHFKCNKRRLADFPNLWAYTKRLYALPGIAETFHMDNTRQHYFNSHRSINPHGIIPVGPETDY